MGQNEHQHSFASTSRRCDVRRPACAKVSAGETPVRRSFGEGGKRGMQRLETDVKRELDGLLRRDYWIARLRGR
jgi:hypothetical protein